MACQKEFDYLYFSNNHVNTSPCERRAQASSDLSSITSCLEAEVDLEVDVFTVKAGASDALMTKAMAKLTFLTSMSSISKSPLKMPKLSSNTILKKDSDAACSTTPLVMFSGRKEDFHFWGDKPTELDY